MEILDKGVDARRPCLRASPPQDLPNGGTTVPRTEARSNIFTLFAVDAIPLTSIMLALTAPSVKLPSTRTPGVTVLVVASKLDAPAQGAGLPLEHLARPPSSPSGAGKVDLPRERRGLDNLPRVLLQALTKAGVPTSARWS